MKYIVSIIVTVILITGFLFWQGAYSPKESGSSLRVQFLVEKGQGAGEIADNLKLAGLIRHSIAFKWHALFSKKADSLKAGEYELSP